MRNLTAVVSVLVVTSLVVGARAQTNPENPARLSTSESVTDVVYVTARRQVERAQDVPISLTSLSGKHLDENGINSILNLDQFVPSLQVFSYNPRNTSVTIRGIGSNLAIVNDGVEPGVGIYVDGVLHARPAEAVFDLPDIDTIEVLRGPQGTLYGKNSVTGAININTLAPSSVFETEGKLSIGEQGHRKFIGSISGPLRDDGKVSARLSALFSHDDGFFSNRFNSEHLGGTHKVSLRGQVGYHSPSGDAFRIIGDYAYYKSRKPVRVFLDVVTTLANGQSVPRNFYQRSAAAGYVPVPFDPYARVTDANTPIHSKMEQGGLSGHAQWRVGDATLTSISSFRFWKWRPSNDDDVTSLSVLARVQQENDARQFTQELRIDLPRAGTLEYSAGLYYFWEQNDGSGILQYGSDAPLWVLGSADPLSRAVLDGLTGTLISTPRINSYAGYGQATWHITPEIHLTGGFRYTYEDKTGGYQQTAGGAPINAFAPAQQTMIAATRALFMTTMSYGVQTSNHLLGGLATLSYQPSEDIMLYATYSHGEKSAGLNLANLAPAIPKVIAPETVDNYEIGLKSSLAGERLTINTNLFWMDDKNYQTTLFDPTTFVIYLANIPGVRSRGLEADIRARPFDGFSSYLSLAYTDASYVSYPNSPAPFEAFTVVAGRLNTNVSVNLSGRPLAGVPKWAFALGAEYAHELSMFGLGETTGYVAIDETFRSGYFSNAGLSIHSHVPGYALTNLRAGLRLQDNKWDFQIWARNLFDEKYLISRNPLVFNTGAITGVVGDPRVVGITLGASF